MSKAALADWQPAVLTPSRLAVCDGCNRCAMRCTAGVQMSHREFLAIQDELADAGLRQSIGRIAVQPKNLDIGDGLTVTMCRFLDIDGQSCAVYRVRPLMCRLLGHVEWMPCPIGAVPSVVRMLDALALMREYALIERRTFEEWEPQ